VAWLRCQTMLSALSEDAELLHLLTCSGCRRAAVAELLNVRNNTFDYDQVFQNISLTGERGEKVVRQIRDRRKEAERLASSLLDQPRRTRLRMLKNPNYQSVDLLEILLERSHSRQLSDPRQALDLAALAYRVALRLENEAEAARAVCLEVNARRLVGDHRRQEGALTRAARHLKDVSERAFFCRTAALVRWEQARTDEATALLQHATWLYSVDDNEKEMSDCTALLGLLYAEQGLLSEALPLLYQGWACMERGLRPMLAQRVGLALVVCLAEAEQEDKANAVLEATWKLYSSSTQSDDMLRVYWREALALASLRRFEEAEHVLRQVLHNMVERNLAEAALVGLNLCGILVEAGRAAEIEAIGSELGTDFSADPAFARIVQSVGYWQEILARDSPAALREHVRFLCADVLRSLRQQGCWIQPLPFA
jgi:tetratricopeptide (TPR) repeat protein